MSGLTIRDVSKSYGSLTVLSGIDIEIDEGDFLVLVGPSGCGKSTLLNMVAGLEDITQGEILIGGRVVNDLEPSERDIAMVFQSYALYPTMSVAANIGFALEVRGVPKAERARAVAEVAGLLKIEHLLDRKPGQLSGGQRQRVAMGRALVRDPQLFLFDEPLSNLDAKLRVDMRTEIKSLHRKTGKTIVYVTHDQVEAMTLATRICVMEGGHIQQQGTPEEIYGNPANTFVAGFMGSPPMNLLPARAERKAGGGWMVSLSHQSRELVLPVPHCLPSGVDGRTVTIGFRPEHICQVASEADAAGAPVATCRIELTEPTGPDLFGILDLGGREAVCKLLLDASVQAGSDALMRFDVARSCVFDAERSVRIDTSG